MLGNDLVIPRGCECARVFQLIGNTHRLTCGVLAYARVQGDSLPRRCIHVSEPTLFPGGVGKTWQPGDFEQLIDDVTTRVFDRFGDDTVVYPGHGDDTTLGAERPHLAEWRERGW